MGIIKDLAAKPVVDIPKLAGSTMDEAAAMLGLPEDVAKTKYGSKAIYLNGQIEIVFINELADWITVSGFGTAGFSRLALLRLALPPNKPTFSSNNVLRWQNIPGLIEVSLFRIGKAVDYAYIKAHTP